MAELLREQVAWLVSSKKKKKKKKSKGKEQEGGEIGQRLGLEPRISYLSLEQLDWQGPRLICL